MYPVATQLICSITSIVTIGYITLLRGNLGLGRVVKANQCRPLLIPNQPCEEPEAFGYYGSVLLVCNCMDARAAPI